MHDFELVGPDAWQKASTSPCVTVADAMAESAGVATRTTVMKAGGIDLLGLMKADLVAPQTVIDLRAMRGLDGIEPTDGQGIQIGALVTLAALARHPLIQSRYAILADAAALTGSPQIRTIGTVAGNLLQRPHCWYFRSKQHHCLKKGGEHCFAISGENQYHAVFDNRPCAIVHPSTLATVLVALGAEIELRGPDGFTRRIALEEFFVLPRRDSRRENDLRPGEILTVIRLPPLPAGARMAYLKQGERDAFDWPFAEVATVIERTPDGRCNNASIVLGAASPVPHRATRAESVLRGRHVDEAATREAAEAALGGAAPLAKNAHKLPVFAALVRRAILQAIASR